jgi:hypothetical protein
LRLRRRRTNVPWIYSLYHADPKPRRGRASAVWDLTELEMAELEFAEGVNLEGDEA